MAAIKEDNRLRHSRGCEPCCKGPLFLAGALSGLIACCFLCATSGTVWAAAAAMVVPVKSIAQLTVDDDGLALGYSSAVFFDPDENETYLINNNTGRVVVYGPDFFPRVSIGIGRGVIAPRGGAVMENGEVYVCQMRNFKNPSPRITILNGAFFVDREIFLDQIPEAEDFIPRHLAVSRDGLIYLASDGYRGVLVLDSDGTYLRKIQPMDQLASYVISELEEQAEAEALEEQKALLEGQESPAPGDAVGMPAAEENPYADIPEEFRPRTDRRKRGAGGAKSELGPVRISYVTIDSSGRLYLLSSETGKVYVYGPDESFLFSFGTKGGSPRQLALPKAVAVDDKRELIYVVDYMRHTILVYNLDGEYIFEIGGRGFAPTWFNFPIDIAINNQQQIIVADLFNKRVQVLEVQYDESLTRLVEEPQNETEPEAPAAGEATDAAGDESDPGIDLEQSQPGPEIGVEMDVGTDAQVEEVIIQEEELPAVPIDDRDGTGQEER